MHAVVVMFAVVVIIATLYCQIFASASGKERKAKAMARLIWPEIQLPGILSMPSERWDLFGCQDAYVQLAYEPQRYRYEMWLYFRTKDYGWQRGPLAYSTMFESVARTWRDMQVQQSSLVGITQDELEERINWFDRNNQLELAPAV